MSESAQPQLPPRLLEHPEFMNRMMNRVAILEAENESLKAQIEERNNRGTGYLYVPKAQYDALKAERNKALEVIRGMATVEETPAGPILRVLSVRVRSELGTCHNAAFQSIAAEINRKADALLPKEKP